MDAARPPPTVFPLPLTPPRDTEVDRAGRELGQEQSEDELYQDLAEETDTVDATLTAFNEFK
jgi:hypothetical protein